MRKRSAKSTTPIPKQKLVEMYRKALAAEIPLEVVDQKLQHFMQRSLAAESIEAELDQFLTQQRRQQIPRHKRVFLTVVPLACISIGLFLVGSAMWPIISYYLFTGPALSNVTLLAPVPADQVLDFMPHIMVQAKEDKDPSRSAETTAIDQAFSQPTILSDEPDFTNLSNWFPSLTLPTVDESKAIEYTIEIPTLEVFNAKVKLGGSNLDKSLIQYPGTALPGQLGSPVIFGHSILRQFYNPNEKNPRRYISIFSKIMTLSRGDKIYITHDNVKYTYIVRDKRVVKPEDTYILDQQYDTKGLRLVTCVPEGTTADRGIIDAELANLSN